MNKSFLANIVLLILANLLIKPLYLFYIDAEVQNVVGNISYEQFFVFFNICYILQFFNDFGIHSYSLKEISQKRDQAKSLLSKLLGTKLLLSVVFASIAFFTWLFFDYSQPQLFFLVAFNVFLSSLLLYLRAALAGMGWYKWDSIVSILDKSFLLGILSYILYFSTFRIDFRIIDFVLFQSCAFGFSIVICTILLWKKRSIYWPSFRIDSIKQILKKSAPYALIFLLMTAYSRVDAIMLKQLIADSARETDAFAACFRLFEAGNMFAYLFAGLLLPMSAYLIQQKKDLKPLIWLGTRMILVLVTIVGFSFFFFREPILSYLYIRYEPFYDQVLLGLLVSFASVAIAYVFGSIAVADGRIKQLNYLFSFCLLLNIALNYWLIPSYGATGASCTSAITQVLSLIGQVLIFQYYLKISWKWYEIWTITFYSLLAFLIFWSLSTFLLLEWMYLMPLCIISTVILAFISGMIDLKEFFSLLRNRVNQ